MGMRNCYKRDDIFLCRDQAHQRFAHRVSAWHVLKEKRCYPDGCVRFLWKCKLLGKGGRCPKDYRHVGANCTQCRQYDEEKLHRRPELLVSPQQFALFREECLAFEEWFDRTSSRRVAMGGEVTDVRPHLVKRVDGPRSSLRLEGFLLRLVPAFIGLQGFDDPLYLPLGRRTQDRLRLSPGDRVEADVWLRLDRGRLVGHEPRQWQVEGRSGTVPGPRRARGAPRTGSAGGRGGAGTRDGGPAPGGLSPGWDRALLDRLGAVPLADQPERCLHCERGVLVDVIEAGRDTARIEGGRRRELFCLEGIGRPEDCPHEALQALEEGRPTARGGR